MVQIVKRLKLKDKRLLVLAIVGLFPTLMLLLPMPEIGVFYVMALYFSCIWGLFFYYFFKTSQVTLRTTITVFFITHLFVFIVWDIFGLVRFNPFYALIESPFPIDLLGFVFGVGLTEELAKMVPLFIIARRAKEPILPRTLVFYGLMAGIAFGVFEGVQYQTTVNIGLDYTSAFYGNIARLTSLPFLHAIWCGIAAVNGTDSEAFKTVCAFHGAFRGAGLFGTCGARRFYQTDVVQKNFRTGRNGIRVRSDEKVGSCCQRVSRI